jgi:2-methylcitrate dehydratase PrpD
MSESVTQHCLTFIHQLQFEQLPPVVVQQAKRCLIDLLGVAAAGQSTMMSQSMGRFVDSQYPGNVPLLFANQRASQIGSALYGGNLIDSVDAHDGQVLTKGHVGVAVLPALLSQLADRQIDGKEFITALVMGYEIATRAGVALHATADDYHTSGAWNALAAAAVVARLTQMSTAHTWEALGIAEFNGPRSQMMRCIDHPTMVKDGSGWGAMTGVSSALLAAQGFTGAPAITISATEVERIWGDLEQRWYILEQYFKAYPVCRWAQPAVEAVREISGANPDLDCECIAEIQIYTFHQGARLHVKHPNTTEQAQYSLPFSVASALLDGIVTAESVAQTEQGLDNPARNALSAKVRCIEVDKYNALFPAERWAHAKLVLNDGRELESSPCIARGNPENPLSDQEIEGKFHTLSAPFLSEKRRIEIYDQVQTLDALSADQVTDFIALFEE